MIDTVGTPLTVPVPGTLVRVTSLRPNPAAHVGVHGIMFQARPANVGRVYIGRATMNRGALTDTYAVIPVPTLNFLPTFSIALTIAPNALPLEDFYVDADNVGDGVLVTFLVS